MTTLFLFLPFFPFPSPKITPTATFCKLFSYIKKSRFFSHFIKTVFSTLLLGKPTFFFSDVCYLRCLPLTTKKKNEEFVWIQTKLQQLISYKVTLKIKLLRNIRQYLGRKWTEQRGLWNTKS